MHTRALNNLRLFFSGKKTVIVVVLVMGTVVGSSAGAILMALMVKTIVIETKRKQKNVRVVNTTTELQRAV